MKRVKVKEVLRYLGFSVIWLLISIFICYINFKLRNSGPMPKEYMKIVAKASIATGFGIGWVNYSVFKYKIKAVGYAVEKSKIAIQGTIICFVLLGLLSLIL